MFPRSIRWRVQMWLAALLVTLLSGFGITAYQLYRTTRFAQVDEELDRRVAALSSDIRMPPPLGEPRGHPPLDPPGEPALEASEPSLRLAPLGRGRPRRGDPFGQGPQFPFPFPREIRLSPTSQLLFDESETNSYYYALWSADEALMKGASNAPPDLVFPGRVPTTAGIVTRMRPSHREAFLTTEFGEVVLVGRSVAADLAAMHRFAWYLVGVGLGVLALGIGGGWLLADRAIRPVELISQAANRISAGNLSERIDVSETDSELGRLAGVLNSMFARLEAAFVQQRQFTADASHELRTPLAVMISATQGTLARERTVAEYRETLETCLATAQQMRQLTQSLLELARLEAGQAGLARHRLDLAHLVKACTNRIRPLAEERGISIRLDLRPAPVLGDAERLSRVLTNLLSNAIEYNRDRGEIRVESRTELGAAIVIVSDTGQGIPADDLPHVFEHFYRGDKARSGSGAEGHVGLGLAIAKGIVEAHGGAITVTSKVGEGSVLTVRLPAGWGGAPREAPAQSGERSGEVPQ